MTKNRQSTRYFSRRQEEHVAKQIGGKVVANSGATTFNKGDAKNDLFLIECKTCMTDKQSFSIKEEWLTKNEEEAFAMRKEHSALAFNFGPDRPNYYIINEKLFKLLNRLLMEETYGKN